MDSDKNADTKNERIVYYLSSNNGSNWKGPQVLYRWGPLLDANGEYVDDDKVLWDAQALIDGINTTPVTNPCSTGTVSTVNPTGFYACISLQDPTKVYQPDKTLQNYNPYNTSQLFLTGQTKTATGVNDNQTNDTQVVARARTAAANSTDKNTSVNWSVEGIDSALGCKGAIPWDMRTDFGNNPDNPDDTTKWVKDGFKNRQPQIIPVRTDNNLVVTGSAVMKKPDGDQCLNKIWGNLVDKEEDKEKLDVSKFNNKVSHEINFNDPRTFNGDSKDETYNTTIVSSNPAGRSREAVQFFKKGGEIPTEYSGYDANNDGDLDDTGDGDQKSLGKFLYDQGYAIPLNGGNPADKNTTFKLPTSKEEINAAIDATNLTPAEKAAKKLEIKVLGDDQRIVGMEIGQKYPNQDNYGKNLFNPDGTPGKNPGFDLQDNIFVVTSDVFKTKFEPSCFTTGNCNPNTGKPKPNS
jgi:hypothetical protein